MTIVESIGKSAYKILSHDWKSIGLLWLKSAAEQPLGSESPIYWKGLQKSNFSSSSSSIGNKKELFNPGMSKVAFFKSQGWAHLKPLVGSSPEKI